MKKIVYDLGEGDYISLLFDTETATGAINYFLYKDEDEEEETPELDAGMEALTSFILRQAIAGFDVESKPFHDIVGATVLLLIDKYQ